jgi:hypothetical protein
MKECDHKRYAESYECRDCKIEQLQADIQRLTELLKVAKMCIYDIKAGMVDIHLISHVWTELTELDEALATERTGQ